MWHKPTVPNELIINVTLGETRVARLENSVVSELYIERAREQGVVGNIYKGKVVRVLPGMQAAFIEIGLDRTAFLHAHDVVQEMTRFEEAEFDEDEEENGESPEAEQGTEAAAEGSEEKQKKPEKKNGRQKRYQRHRKSIEDLLEEGKEVMVQVEKEPIGTKGARLTSHISLPGRYLVYMPTVSHIGISRRIGNAEDRRRLREMIYQARPKGSGFIVRTACVGVSDDEIRADMNYLIKTWEEIEGKASKPKAPALIHQDLDVVLRTVRDLCTPDVDRLVIDSRESLDHASNFIKTFMPGLRTDLVHYKNEEPIFDHFGIEVEITRALGQKVWLKSGGYIIIEQTEALTAIDVNTGRFVGRRNLQETIVKTNLEAIKEIVYQLRLRNIGGIIILDLIDMERHSDRTKVYNALKEALKADRARTTITKISDLGLVEMTRKRTREDLRRQLTDPCPYCEERGHIKSATTVSYEIFREIRREAPHFSGKTLHVYCHKNVAAMLYDEERLFLEQLEKEFKKRIQVKQVAEYHPEQFDISEE